MGALSAGTFTLGGAVQIGAGHRDMYRYRERACHAREAQQQRGSSVDRTVWGRNGWKKAVSSAVLLGKILSLLPDGRKRKAVYFNNFETGSCWPSTQREIKHRRTPMGPIISLHKAAPKFCVCARAAGRNRRVAFSGRAWQKPCWVNQGWAWGGANAISI